MTPLVIRRRDGIRSLQIGRPKPLRREVPGRPPEAEQALLHHADALGPAGHGAVVGDQHHGQAALRPGYEAIREQILARQKEMGIVPADTDLPPLNPIGTPQTRTGPDGLPYPPLDYTKPWDSLSADEKRLFARMAEVYAGFLSHADHHIGRLLDYLEESGQRENTVVIVVSDSGAAVTGDYAGERPWRFTGGTIKRVAVDVSGEPYLDLEREAAAMLARE